MPKLNFLILFMFVNIALFAQDNFKEGKVSYTSSQLVYVSFENTEGIAEGDTIFIKLKNSLQPALKVKYISSSSAACEKLSSGDFKSGLAVFASVNDIQPSVIATSAIINQTAVNEIQPIQNEVSTKLKSTNEIDSKISGRYSIQSYSNFNNVSQYGDYQRWRHSLRFGLQNIGSSGLSFSTYAIFAYKADEWNTVSSDISNALKVYDFNLNYKFSNSTQIWLGRYLNRKISNISIVDGLQFENAFSFLTLGLVVGSRPDYRDFSFNPKLLEYGAYLSRSDTLGSGMMENTISLFEQTNDNKTDRRFAYIQHSNTIITNTYLFASAEVDLYKKELNVPKSEFSLTSLFLSARYSPVRVFSLSLSYDSRRNVYYYETYKSLSDSVLDNELRQGFRARAVVKPINNIIIGLQYGYRYSKTDVKPSRNYGGNISYTAIPLIQSSLGFNYNRLLSNYVDGSVYSVNLIKSISALRSDFSIGFRKTDYTFLNNSPKLDEKAILVDISTSVFAPFSFSISYEGVFESTRTYGRILLDLTTRF